MKTTIEIIDGVPHTVIWYIEPDFWDLSEFIGVDKTGVTRGYTKQGDIEYVALPALPRNPRPEDAPLLHMYAAHGLVVQMTGAISAYPFGISHNSEITHCTHNGERVEVAIL